MAEVVKAAGVDPNIPFNGLPSPWKKDDAAWFEAHPHRAHRVRDRFPYERFKGEPSDLPNAAISKIIVRQIRPGLRVRAAFIVKECDPDAIAVLREMIEMAELRESVAHALFESTQNNGRLVQIHEIVAMIEQYEIRCRARGELKEDAPMDDFTRNPGKAGGAGSAKNDDAAVIFLRQLRPAGPWMLLAIDPESGRIEAKTIENTDGVRSFVAKHNGTRNLYYSLNPTRTRMGKKAAKTDIARIEYVPTDLDPKHDEPPEEAKKRYLTEIGKFKKKPTAVIDSGNGLNVIFKLAKPIELPEPVIAKGRRRPNGEPQSESLVFDDETQKVIADIEGRAAQLMKDLGSAAGTQNIDRILRLPGTTNLPTKKKQREGRVQCRAKLIEFGTSTFAPDDFPKAPAHQHGESQSKPKDDKKAKASRPPGTKKELSPRLIGMLMVPNGGAGVKHYYDGYTYESRSGLLYGFLRGCISREHQFLRDVCRLRRWQI